MNYFEKRIQKELQYSVDTQKACQNNIENMLLWKARFGDLDLSVFEEDMYCYFGKNALEITLTKQNSKLAHALSQALSVTFVKEKSFDGSSLVLRATLPNGAKISINGYIPDTCRVEEIQEMIPESEIVRIRKRTVIHCD